MKTKFRFFKPFLIQLEERLNLSPYAQPVFLNSLNGVLDVTLTANQIQDNIETTPGTTFNSSSNPTQVLTGGLYTYQWQLNNGVATNADGSPNNTITIGSSGNNYVAPNLKVNRGDLLRITMVNNLPDSIPLAPDVNTAFKTISPGPIGPQPINNHMHGLHVSPAGSSDNVLLEIPQKMGFVYEYTIPQSQPEGLFWIHNHRHEFTSDQTYRGLAAALVVGNSTNNPGLSAASNIDQISGIPAANQRVMSLQTQSFASTSTTINPTVPSYILNPTQSGAAYTVGGTNVGTAPAQILQYFQGGTVSSFTDPPVTEAVLANKNGPNGVPVSFVKQYTVNGQINPTITVPAGQTEVWSFNNFSPVTNFQISLFDQNGDIVSNNLFQISQDGNALVNPVAGNDVIVAPGSRYSFVITAPGTAGQSFTLKATDITSGTSASTFPISLVTITADNTISSPLAISTSTVLTSSSNPAFEDLSGAPVVESRTVIFSSTAANPNAGGSIAGGTGNQFQVNGQSFPDNIIFQPRLNTVEEWTLLNYTNQPHPFHIHVNDMQVMSIFAPTEPSGSVQFYPGNVTIPYQYGLDVINIPPALYANNVITGIKNIAGGSGFTNGQIVNIQNPANQTLPNATGSATVDSSGQITAVTILGSGTSGVINQSVNITGAGGTTPGTGTMVIQNGVVVSNLIVTDGGSGFTNKQTVTISSATGTVGSGKATVNSSGIITGVTFTSSNAGFVNNQTVNILGGTTGATGTMVIQNGVVVPNSPPSQNAVVNGQASNTFGNVLQPGKIVLRYKPKDFTGTYVYHCHLLTHEDRGMMGQVTVLPNLPIYATGAGPGGAPQVNVFSSLDNSLVTSFLAFEPGFAGGVSTAVADVNNDGISDLICGAGPGGGPRVTVFNGATNFTTVLQDFFAFDQSFRGGVDVAGADYNVDGFADIVVSAGPGGGPEVRVFDAKTLNALTQFFAYDTRFSGGVTVATGDVDGSGLPSLVTGAGPGGGPHVKIWRNSLMFEMGSAPILPGAQTISIFTLTGEFMAYELPYTGGVNVSTGLVGGMSQGGFDRIITGTIGDGGPLVSVFQAMSAHDAAFPMSATPGSNYDQVATFFAFDSTSTEGVFVGAVAGSNGSDLIVSQGKGSNTLKRFSFLPGTQDPTFEEEFNPFPIGFLGGVSLGGTN